MGRYEATKAYKAKVYDIVHAPRPACRHTNTAIVRTPDSELRDSQVIDGIEVLTCTDCGVPVGVL